MAYKANGMIFPYHAGEFCGNHYPNGPQVFSFDAHRDEAIRKQEIQWHKEWLGKMSFGSCHNCKAGNIQKMHKQGYVGLYLKENSTQKLNEDDELVPTPPELMEPGKEHLYNLNGKFGMET